MILEPQPTLELQEDAKEILPGKAYHWHDWSIVRGNQKEYIRAVWHYYYNMSNIFMFTGRDCLYIWSESAALELSNGSNGWFRFILDGKLATMYSSGSPENGSDSSGYLDIFLLLINIQIEIFVPKANQEQQMLFQVKVNFIIQ